MLVVAQSIFWIILAVTLLSLVPMRLTSGYATWVLYLPVFSLLLYLLYEVFLFIAVPLSSVPLRIDLAIILPSLFITLGTSFLRWVVVWRIRRRGAIGTGVKTQALIFVPMVVVALILFWLMW